jgi:hypothetical protein
MALMLLPLLQQLMCNDLPSVVLLLVPPPAVAPKRLLLLLISCLPGYCKCTLLFLLSWPCSNCWYLLWIPSDLCIIQPSSMRNTPCCWCYCCHL